jgi:hypothetical protein
MLNRWHDVASQGWRSCQFSVRRVSGKPYNTQVRFCIARKGYSELMGSIKPSLIGASKGITGSVYDRAALA